MKVLFVLPPSKEIYCPIGMALVAAQARKQGHEVATLDIGAYRLSRESVVGVIKKAKFDLVAVGGVINQYGYAEWLFKAIRSIRPKTHIVAGGTAATSTVEIFLRNNDINTVISGEAEFSFSRYLEAVESGSDPIGIPGVFRRTPDGGIAGAPPEYIDELDSVPFPAWDLFPMEAYLNQPSNQLAGVEFPLVFSRGCLYTCYFCIKTKSRKMRYHSPERVLAEIKILHENYGVDCFTFVDNNFVGDPQRVDALCDALIDYGKTIFWGCAFRADFKNFDLMEKMYLAGCRMVFFGIESGSPSMLKNIGKHLNLEQAKITVNRAKEIGFHINYNYIIGAPEESRETLMETYNFAKEAGLPIRRFTFLTPVPDTKIWDVCLKLGVIKNPLSYLRTINFDKPSVNLTKLSTKELVDEFFKVKMESEAEFSKSSLTEKRKVALFGDNLVKKESENALLRHDYTPFHFSHPGGAAIHFDARFNNPPFPDKREMQKALQDIVDKGENSITLTGAEPMENPHFEDVILFSVMKFFMEVRLVTNGRKLKEREFAEKIAESPISQIAVELCGPDAATHDPHTRVDGGFLDSLAGIENMLSLKMPVMVSIPLTKLNISSIHRFPKLLRAIGVSVVQLKYEPNPFADKPQDIFPDLNAIRDSLEEIIGVLTGAGLRVRVDGIPLCALAKYQELYFSKTVPYCISTTVPQMKNPRFISEFIQGPKCGKCAQNLRCIGIQRAYHEIYGWEGLVPFPKKRE